MEHSGGKWIIEKSDFKEDVYHLYIKEGDNVTWAGESDLANAQRIVTCVNACEGIATEELDCSVGFIAMLKNKLTSATNLLEIAIAERDKARSVKDTLLESLKTILDPECMEDIRLLIKEAEEGKDGYY